jgi:nitrate reductase gamma subunit
VISPLKPSGHFMYRKFYTSTKYKYCVTAYLYVSYDSQNKEKIFPYTSIKITLLLPIWRVFTARYALTLYTSQCTLTSKEAVPWLKRLVAELRRQKPRFISKTFHLGYVVGKMWHCNRFLSQYFGSALSVASRTRSILVFI